MAGITASLGRINPTTYLYEGQFVNQLVTTKSYYSDCRFDKRGGSRDTSTPKTELEFKSSHGRTMLSKEFMEHSNVFAERHKDTLPEKCGVASRAKNLVHERRKQSFWSTFVNRLFAFADYLHKNAGTLQTKAPLLILGGAKIGSRRGQKTVPSEWLLKFLSKSFAVVILDEWFTSQKCPKCFRKLKAFGNGIRLKKCDCCHNGAGTGPFIVNRDISAPQLMTTTVLSLTIYGKRPRPLTPLKHDDLGS